MSSLNSRDWFEQQVARGGLRPASDLPPPHPCEDVHRLHAWTRNQLPDEDRLLLLRHLTQCACCNDAANKAFIVVTNRTSFMMAINNCEAELEQSSILELKMQRDNLPHDEMSLLKGLVRNMLSTSNPICRTVETHDSHENKPISQFEQLRFMYIAVSRGSRITRMSRDSVRFFVADRRRRFIRPDRVESVKFSSCCRFNGRCRQ